MKNDLMRVPSKMRFNEHSAFPIVNKSREIDWEKEKSPTVLNDKFFAPRLQNKPLSNLISGSKKISGKKLHVLK